MASGDILSAIASQKTLEEVKERLGKIGSSGKDISEILEELLVQPKVIKHIQTGEMSISNIPGTISLIGFSDITKMIHIIQGYNGNGDHYCSIYGINLTTTTLTIKAKYINRPTQGSYQVIEFY